MTAEEWWRDVTAAALLGSARRPPPALPEEMGVTARADAEPATALLDAAALGGTLQRAGRCASRQDAAEPAPPERRPEAPARAVQVLELALHQSPAGRELRVPLVQEWLSAAAAAEVRLPHRLLPALLDLATGDVRLRNTLPAVAGTRGAWLAEHNPAWEWWAGPADPQPDEWAVLPGGQRAELVRTLRRSDPERARQLVASTWATDAASERKVLVEALRIGATEADEPFLENALDDRAKGVREAALDVLDRVPASRRAARMAAHLQPLIGHTKRLLGHTVTVELPPDADEAGQRDGLVRPGTGARSRNLAILAGSAPLAVWTEATGLPPRKILELVTDRDVLSGLERAALLQRDPEWILAFAEHGSVSMLAHLEPAVRARLAPALVARVTAAPDARRTVTDLAGPWDGETSAAMLAMVTRALGKSGLREHLVTLATRLHPATVPQLQRLAGSDRADAAAAGHLVQYLTLRHTLREAFA